MTAAATPPTQETEKPHYHDVRATAASPAVRTKCPFVRSDCPAIAIKASMAKRAKEAREDREWARDLARNNLEVPDGE